MATFPKSSQRHRTKDRMIEDVLWTLNSPLSYGAKYGVLYQVTWEWSEIHGKYLGCPYWSKLALMWYASKKTLKELRHEHVVPKKVVIDMLFKLSQLTAGSVKEICERLLIGVVLTKVEDEILNVEFGSSMPPEFFDEASPGFNDVWLRYRRHPEIEIVECEPGWNWPT